MIANPYFRCATYPVKMVGTGTEGVAKKVVETVKPKRTTFSEILLGESRVMCR